MNEPEHHPTQTPGTPPPASPGTPPGQAAAPSRVKLSRVATVAAVLIVAGFIIGFIPRWHQRSLLRAETVELATPTVSVVSPAPSQASAGLSLPAEVRPLLEAPIYARANGYLKRWLVDIAPEVLVTVATNTLPGISGITRSADWPALMPAAALCGTRT